MSPLENFFPLLQKQSNVVITMHQKPDGDAMGAALAIYQFFIQLGHGVTVISPTNWAGFLNWMPQINKVLNYETNTEVADRLIAAADWIFCVDFNALPRTKKMESSLLKARAIKVLIDHHELPQTEVFDYGNSNADKSSTCEMVYDFMIASGNRDKITLDIAACIYTGLMMDTGSFRFPSATASVHLAIAYLKEIGLDHSVIHEKIYDVNTEDRLHLTGNSLLHKIEVLYEYNTALMVITKPELLKYHAKTGDTESLVNYLLSIEGIKFGAMLIDRGDERKWSFRSKGDFDVNLFARKHFNGGGHKNAAGGFSQDSIFSTVQKFKNILLGYKDALN